MAEDNLYQVTRHTALLLLLHSGRRIHDLTLLNPSAEDFQITEESVTFWPSFGSKTDSAKHRQSGWLFTKNPIRNLNAVFWVKKLLEVSQKRRLARQNLDSLFITTRGPVRAASRAIKAGWIKSCFKDAGINASAGSVRAAVASDKFLVQGRDLDEILEKGNWRSKQTVFNHYFKEVAESINNSERPSDYFDCI